jgi:hypothetical protein
MLKKMTWELEMFKILIGIIHSLEFWKVGRTECKRVKYVSMMSPRVRDVGRKTLLKQRVSPFPQQLPGACTLSVLRGNDHTFPRVRIDIL